MECIDMPYQPFTKRKYLSTSRLFFVAFYRSLQLVQSSGLKCLGSSGLGQTSGQNRQILFAQVQISVDQFYSQTCLTLSLYSGAAIMLAKSAVTHMSRGEKPKDILWPLETIEQPQPVFNSWWQHALKIKKETCPRSLLWCFSDKQSTINFNLWTWLVRRGAPK